MSHDLDSTEPAADGPDPLVVISTFTVSPDRQAELARVLTEASDRVLRHQQGFLGSTIEVSLDGTRVVNHARWSSADALNAMQRDPACREHMAWIRTVARVDPVRYRVASRHTA